jgi:hypothetical protein
VATASRHWWSFANRPKAKPVLDDHVDLALGSNGASTAPKGDLDSALDLVARMLRLVGEVPVLPDQPNLNELRATCEIWARHILTGTPTPGATPLHGAHPVS